jgi:hypothetical protein
VSERGPPEPKPYRALVGLAAIVALVIGVLFIVHRLDQAGRIQDCVAKQINRPTVHCGRC